MTLVLFSLPLFRTLSTFFRWQISPSVLYSLAALLFNSILFNFRPGCQINYSKLSSRLIKHNQQSIQS